MANGVQNQERVPENLTKQLAVAVRSIQWSYAIFWSLSTTQQGVLEWKDGYYNGDIKTRRTAQAIELKANKVGMQRSEQLKELYESLLHEEEEEDEEEDETDEEAKRPCAVLLSPEDLTDTEWYYLVCMSFVFNPGQGLPGRALKNGQPIWLCNAHDADSKIFSRSLLAKSASIQTVVCFPHLGGVIELGVTELVLEDPNLIHHIKASLLELSKPICSDRSSSPLDNKYDDQDPICASIDGDEMVNKIASEKFYSRTEDTKHDQDRANELEENTDEDYSGGSRDDCSHCSEQNDHTEYLNLHGSINSSHCASQDCVNQAKANSPLKLGNINNLQLSELQECNDYLHYRRTVLTILRNSQRSIGNLCSCDRKSSFLSWKKGGKVDDHRSMDKQSMLKKILFNVPLMNGGRTTEENGRKIWSIKKENDNIYAKHVFPKNRMENEKFLVLGSMVPSISKINKASILDDTIEYLKELEERIEELESGTDLTKSKERTGMTCLDMVEEISDNYENKRLNYGTTPRINKRKACDIDGTETELNSVGLPLDMKVQISEEGVLIEMRCLSREYLLLDIIDALNNLDLDAHSVQSCTLDGVLTLTLRSKVRGEAVASATMIKQALKKVAGRF